MNWTDEQKPLIEAYAKGYAWLQMHENEGDTENFKKVNDRMMQIEDELRAKDVTPDQLGKVIEGVTKILAKTTGEMTSRELEFVLQIIFGKEAKLQPSTTKPTDQIFVNGRLMTYAYYQNHKAEVDAMPPPEHKDDVVDKNKQK